VKLLPQLATDPVGCSPTARYRSCWLCGSTGHCFAQNCAPWQGRLSDSYAVTLPMHLASSQEARPGPVPQSESEATVCCSSCVASPLLHLVVATFCILCGASCVTSCCRVGAASCVLRLFVASCVLHATQPPFKFTSPRRRERRCGLPRATPLGLESSRSSLPIFANLSV
jgi:hypothetical protein